MADANSTPRTIPLHWVDCLEGYNTRLYAIHRLIIAWMDCVQADGVPAKMHTLSAGLDRLMTDLHDDYQQLHDNIDALRQAYNQIDRQHD